MNFIYKLTNIDKQEGRRFYIGSKQESAIEEIDGIPTIVSLKTGYPYYGSSSCPYMKQDMQNKHRFIAEILEDVPQKKDLLGRENFWIKQLNAVESEDYYNMSYAVISGSYDQDAPINIFGETISQYAKARSSINKRNNTAKRFGFKNLGDFSVWIYKEILKGGNGVSIGEMLKWERHAPTRFISKYNMEKCLQEYDPSNKELQTELRMLLARGASILKVAEIKELEIPTVCLYIDDFDEIYKRSFRTAMRRGFSKDELEIIITKKILDGQSINEVGREMAIDTTSVKRYFMRCVRARLKSSDL